MKTYRTDGLLPADASRKVIVILGLGSVGASVALDIPYEFGMLVLIDPGKLKPENVERHPLGNKSVGVNKAIAVRDFLINEKGVPAGKIKAYAETEEKVLPLYKNADLVICAIDDKVACRRVNTWCVENNVPAVYAGVYPLGLGGEVIAIPTPRQVCYLCAEHQRANVVLPPTYEGNYGVNPELLAGQNTDSPKAVPALKNSVTTIAADQASIAWRMLFGEPVLPQIRFHALEGWTEVARIHSSSSELNLVARTIAARKNLLLAEDNARLSPPDKEGWYGYEIRRQLWPKAIIQWTRCSMHGKRVQFTDL